jgi:hypothetical protein
MPDNLRPITLSVLRSSWLHKEEDTVTDQPDARENGDNESTRRTEDDPELGHGRVGSGAPVDEDPTGDVEYRGTDDRDSGPIFVETPDGEQAYGRTTR